MKQIGVIRLAAENIILGFFLLSFTALVSFSVLAIAKDTGKEIVIVAFGDSLTAGYGLPPLAAFPVQLEAALKKKGHRVRVLNAGVSGDTTSGGLARLDWSVPSEADAVILELGANDALRGLDAQRARETLDKIISRLKTKGVEILLAGMEAPRGNGPDYVRAFSRMYPDLAEKHDILLYPFFLEGVALKAEFVLADGLHPNVKGVGIMVENILPKVEALIERVQVAASQ